MLMIVRELNDVLLADWKYLVSSPDLDLEDSIHK